MSVSIISFADGNTVSAGIAKQLQVAHVEASIHRFPDGESCISIGKEHIGQCAVVVCSLNQPDSVAIPLVFLIETLRDHGAKQVILVAPYLAYMRQDRRFHEGESISARYFARLLSIYCDVLVTVDPHLHRIKSLDEIYSIPAYVIHAAGDVASWVQTNIDRPLLIGPDSESKQWVSELARLAGANFLVLEKIRHGDRDVEVRVPDVDKWRQYTPVLFDDIISTGRTMIETVGHLKNAGLPAAVCIGIHGVFSGGACEDMLSAGVARVVTTNTITHTTNSIDISSSICKQLETIIS